MIRVSNKVSRSKSSTQHATRNSGMRMSMKTYSAEHGLYIQFQGSTYYGLGKAAL